jgi:hypothetical protein
MADATGAGKPAHVDPELVESHAIKLLRNPDEHGLEPGDIETARAIARRKLADSEGRIYDPATTDPEQDGVIRRDTGETAATGDNAHE